MTRIVVDETLRNRLHHLTEPLELCDEEGHVLARVVPVLDPRLYDLEPKITEEELRGYPGSLFLAPKGRQ